MVIAFSIVVNNCVQLARIPSEEVEARDNQLFSLYLVVPFIGTACALLVHNWSAEAQLCNFVFENMLRPHVDRTDRWIYYGLRRIWLHLSRTRQERKFPP